jgi:hypothetical protein
VRENGGNDPHEPLDYQALLAERWVEVIVKAHAARQTAKLSVVVPQQHGIAFNRRFLMKDGSTGWNPGKLNTNVFRPIGPTDPDLPCVLVRDAVSGKPLGSLTVFAMHTAIYGGAPFGACYPGYLQTHLRRQLDAPDFIFRHEFWQKHGGKLPQEIQAIRLDRAAAIVTLPHEVFVELGMAIKSASPFRTTIVVSLANDLDFCIPTRRAFEEGHYEPATCPLEPGCGELLVQAAVKLLYELRP